MQAIFKDFNETFAKKSKTNGLLNKDFAAFKTKIYRSTVRASALIFEGVCPYGSLAYYSSDSIAGGKLACFCQGIGVQSYSTVWVVSGTIVLIWEDGSTHNLRAGTSMCFDPYQLEDVSGSADSGLLVGYQHVEHVEELGGYTDAVAEHLKWRDHQIIFQKTRMFSSTWFVVIVLCVLH